ncbi:primosomal protein N' [Candidatus Fermentibacteria bacterium]|nr:MAG: primosomal protein N' [Candidatus Fermentibacteria bacterium]
MEQSIETGHEAVTTTVAVAVPRPVWNTYTYMLPDHMSGGNLIGCRAAVPLGKSRVAGVVWKVNPPVPEEMKLRNVLERLDSSPLLPPKVMDLIKWAANYYMEPPGLMASAAFPPGMQGRAVRMVQVSEKSQLRQYCGCRDIQYAVLTGIAGPDVPVDRILAEEEASGLAESWWKPEKLPPEKVTSVIVPLAEPEELIREGTILQRRAPKQAEILACLAASGETPKMELLRMAGAGRNSLERLRQAGLIREESRKVNRDPLLSGKLLDNKPVPVLTTEQNKAVKLVTDKGEGAFLLHGVTGSGKTEVYLKLIGDCIARGKGAIVLVPEISLTPLAVSRFSSRFPGQVAVLHSGLSKGERLDTWNMVRSGRRRIVIGPRSAVFAPVTNLGIMVIDEEHDGSYKQGSIPRYNARDMAVVRGKMEGIPVLLGSASPSAESMFNAMSGRYELIALPDRATGRPLPQVTIVDSSKQQHPLLSSELLAAIGKRTAAGEQSIVLINRRGFSPLQMCFACGHVEKCPSCGISFTYHKKGNILKCHHCGRWKSASSRCPQCSGEEFARQGPGIQKVEQALNELLPRTKVIRMDADTTRGKSAHWKIIEKFSRGEGDVLLGTQMVAKGHDFPEVTLAAVIGAEMGLYLPDFRAAETTFNLLLQAAGRSGRSDKSGEVIMQTLTPDNPVITMACSHDYNRFIQYELNQRKQLGFPPFSRIARLIWSGKNRDHVSRAASDSCRIKVPERCRIMGPSEAAMARINDRWRFNALIIAPDHLILRKLVLRIRESFCSLSSKTVRLDIDVDPRNMM